MREFLVADLAKNILGPRELREVITIDSPLIKYLTGILAPKNSDWTPEISELENQGRSGEGDWNDPLPSISSDVKPPLDPGSITNTMGISFTTKSEKPTLKVCITWSRYRPRKDGNTVLDWTREPKFAVLSIEKQEEFNFDRHGNPTQNDNDAEIRLSVIRRKIQGKTDEFFYSLVVENRIKSSGENQKPEEHIFQPQIRVVCDEKTNIIESFDPQFSTTDKKESDTYEILYRNRGIFARGMLVSATWKAVDPQINKDTANLKFPDSVNDTPFEWIDGELLADADKKLFSEPDVRTEYLPLYSIASPEYGWSKISKSDEGKPYTANLPEMKASVFAELFDAQKLRESLEPVTEAYENWIKEVETNLAVYRPEKDEIVDGILNSARETLQRMKDGIDTICNNDDVRLAFCFANKAIDMQHSWKSNEPFEYRPFQVGFILTTIESIVNPNSQFRETCDLLWVPTGAGKTEAYLMLTALLISYRRLRELKTDRSGAGVAVVTRYTLRLLAIQQFRRTLSVFCACEKLRVTEEQDGTVGWKPKDCKKIRGILWGSTSFSVGLWVGRALTPNNLTKRESWRNGQAVSHTDGAVDIIKKRDTPIGSDPCQVTNCPACRTDGFPTILAVSPQGLEVGRQHTIFITIRASDTNMPIIRNALQGCLGDTYTVNVTSTQNVNPEFYTLGIQITPNRQNLTSFTLNNSIETAINNLNLTDGGVPQRAQNILLCTPSRPGYFLRTRLDQRGNSKEYDFDIICPNPECNLGNAKWFAGTPMGSVHNSTCPPQRHTDVNGRNITDGNCLVDVQTPFDDGNNISERIPIPALTVDDQVYARAPTVIVSTVDKFARPAFEPEAGVLFGNVDRYHAVFGYFRSDAGRGTPPELSGSNNFTTVPNNMPPELAIQDELHLIEGPLGSMVGIYETVNDFLFSEGQQGKIKYIASTATVRRAEEQVRAVFARELSLFPPHGDKINNRFFLKDEERHALDSKESGRLYMGVCAPGKGGLTPHRKIWGSLLQSTYSLRNSGVPNDEIDPFWTLTGYFNAVRELSGVQALYSQDIPAEIKLLERNDANRRPLPKDGLVEISSRKPATEIPAYLDLLNTPYTGPNTSPDALLTTSMFGTGVDVSRINTMVVAGQPKTTSSYIQATGRVGRQSGALVVTFFRSARPRDLSHYELFTGNHRQIQRFVEAPTVFPFADKNMNHCFGPMSVFILRNRRNKTRDWGLDTNPVMDGNQRNLREVNEIPDIFETRAQSQPALQKPPSRTSQMPGRSADMIARNCLDDWRRTTTDEHGNPRPLAQGTTTHGFKFKEYFKPDGILWNDVVLGDIPHQFARDRENPQDPPVRIVYENAPSSLREVEPDFQIETADSGNNRTMALRRSSFIYTYGPGSIVQTDKGPRVIPNAQIGLFDPSRGISPDEFRINDPRIDSVLPGLLPPEVRAVLTASAAGMDVAIYKIPTNDELQLDPNTPVHLTREFPDEKLCTNYVGHLRDVQARDRGILFKGNQCPVCRNSVEAPEPRAIRFITACTGGHMDEINWHWWIHRNLPNELCPRDQTVDQALRSEHVFYWNETSAATTSIRIECPRCNNSVAFGDIYGTPTNCSGRSPEHEPLNSQALRPSCNLKSHVVQMQATNLRTSEVITLLSLDEHRSSIEDIFYRNRAKEAANHFEDLRGEVDESRLDEFFGYIERQGSVPQGQIEFLRTCDRNEVIQAIANRNPDIPDTYEELLKYEFSELVKGSNTGVPAGRVGGRQNKFVMNLNNMKIFDGGGRWNRKLRVSTVDQLTTLSIQLKYQREIRDDLNTPYVPQSTHRLLQSADGTIRMWFPGVEFQGEGLFVRFDDNDGWITPTYPSEHKNRKKWKEDGYDLRNGPPAPEEPHYKPAVFRGKENSERDELDPHFVWWHTFAHTLVRAISDDAGYSAAAIRERVYFERDAETGKVRGGILLFASQPGTEGTLGGLIALASRFDQFVEKAIEQINTCSADPLCNLNSFETAGYIGAACHGCTMNSETSCELRNMFLDRKVFMEDPL